MSAHIGVFLRGMAMGAADIVPGVSGGTIAFITGIYFRLLGAISAVPSAVWYSLARGRLLRFWHEIDGTFLLTLLAGILCSIFTLAALITAGLEHYPVPLWSFFFGLILASVWHVLRQLQRWSWSLLIPLVAGSLFVFWVTRLSAGQAEPTLLTFFWSGALAICAMILPGISGSFILLVIGMYAHILSAVSGLQVTSLLVFMLGCVIGLLTFARVLGVALRRWHDGIMALLTGFMIGALNRIWPWQEVTEWRTTRAGEQVPVSQFPVGPERYAEVTGEPAMVIWALIAVSIGMMLVVVADYRGRRAPVSGATSAVRDVTQ